MRQASSTIIPRKCIVPKIKEAQPFIQETRQLNHYSKRQGSSTIIPRDKAAQPLF